ncbi:MAG: hypothetical protein JXP34_15500 [Planctomycetes bacterium]|nr:hypothetical protein [Planctomycetota bacterium]
MAAGIAMLALILAGDAPKAPDAPKTPETFLGLPLLFQDDFESGKADRWEPGDSAAWKVVRDGERTVYSLFRQSKYEPPHRSPLNMSLIRGLYVSDFVLDLEVRSTKEDYPHRDLCLFFGFQDRDRYYYVHLGLRNDDHSNSVFIVNRAPRTNIVKTRAEGTPWEERYHRVRIVRRIESGEILVYFDDMEKPRMTAVDRTFAWGLVGVGSFDDIGNFDDVRLWAKGIDRAAVDKEPPASVEDARVDVEPAEKRR